jgi:hypothetical protein
MRHFRICTGMGAALLAVMVAAGCAPKADLSLRAEPGAKRQVKVTSENKVSMEMKGLEMLGLGGDGGGAAIEQRLTNSWTLEVMTGKVEADGGTAFTATYNDVTAEMAMGAGDQMFGGMGGMLKDAMPKMEAARGMAFTGVILPDGSLARIEGHDAILDAVADASKSLPDILRGGVRERLRDTLSNEGARRMWEDVLVLRAPGPLRRGQSWTQESRNAGAPGGSTCTYTVREITPDAVMLDMVLAVSASGGEAGLGSMNVTGSGTGTAELDRKTGWVKRIDANTEGKGELTMMGMSMPVTVNATFRVEASPM